MNNGAGLYLPLETFQQLADRSDTNAYWVVATERDDAAVDALAARLEDALGAAGYPVGTELQHVEKAANIDSNRVVVSVLAVMGIPIVLIGLIGLVNAMTMNVIERTRDVGILRCIGASARAVRRIFRVEAMTVALMGAVIAVPLGWVVGRALVELVVRLFDFGSVPYTFPWPAAGFAPVVTLVLAWLVVVGPLRRATRLRPGDALRYE
jgi:putative ABC transport system permease protein